MRKFIKHKFELAAEKWFDNHNFKLSIEKQMENKTTFKIEKDGISDEVEIPVWVLDDFDNYMNKINSNFETKKELQTAEANI